MSPFHSLDELVQAGETQLPPSTTVGPLAPSTPLVPATSLAAPVAAKPARARRAPRTVKKRTRLTATPDFPSLVNQTDVDAHHDPAPTDADGPAQSVGAVDVGTEAPGEMIAPAGAAISSAGEQEPQNPVNHTEVVVPPDLPDEMQRLLAKIGVNLRVNQLGRKHVLDAFMRGRLVSLLAMGLTLRQAAAALGLSHSAIWKELRKNAELSEQVNAARFQAQIEPLLVILRESKRSWRAATWLIDYLSKSLMKYEQTRDEMGRYDKEAAAANAREMAEHHAMVRLERAKADRKVIQELNGR
jgi:hypothetical protein